jgi:GABA(A) receptor-associated protein|tara:strand:- start:6966 stop:7310 length:345 start_codon:yes stop_codon:yes gene_type:complete
MKSFKDKIPFAQRKAEAIKIREKYPDRIPVICERFNNNIKDLDKRKYLVPSDLTMAGFMFVIRRRLALPPDQSIFMFCNEAMVPTASLMGAIYEERKDEDGFLYVVYGGESTFG